MIKVKEYISPVNNLVCENGFQSNYFLFFIKFLQFIYFNKISENSSINSRLLGLHVLDPVVMENEI